MKLLKVDSDPKDLEKDVLYIFDGLLIFLCPCGCGAVIKLNLDPGYASKWVVFDEGDYGPTVYPMISRVVGCHSTFSIKRGEVYYVK